MHYAYWTITSFTTESEGAMSLQPRVCSKSTLIGLAVPEPEIRLLKQGTESRD